MLVSSRLLALFSLSALSLFSQDRDWKGVHPRATPDDYETKVQGRQAAYAASVIPAQQAKQMFSADITGKYLIFEIACFPKETDSAQLDTDDFVIRSGTKGDTAHTADPSAIASAILKEPAAHEVGSLGGDTHVSTEAEIGHESGRDPVTGRPVSGTYTGGGVAVEHGRDSMPDPVRSGPTSEDRKELESQLRNHQLPAGKFTHPVAGYLYFPKSLAKKDSAGNYVLEHLGETDSGSSEKLELVLPAKKR